MEVVITPVRPIFMMTFLVTRVLAKSNRNINKRSVTPLCIIIVKMLYRQQQMLANPNLRWKCQVTLSEILC